MALPDRVPGAPVGQLSPQDWMQALETRAVLAALEADGVRVRFVGGCVRDSVLKRPIRDIDIATPDPPQRVLALLDEAGIRAIPTGIAHGTVTAVIGKAHFEITTLRRDVESFGRRARVEYTDDWVADASRRDFTMNALSVDAEGRVYDPFDGLADLGAGRVRFVGDPVRRIEEDVLRLLRFFRFHAHYGRRAHMDESALAACRRLAGRLETLSGERVAGEMLRLLAAEDPATVLIPMHGLGILAHILPQAADFGRLRQLSWLESRGLVRDEVRVDSLRRLAACLRTDRAGAQAVAERLRLSGAETARLVALAAPPVAVTAAMAPTEARRTLRRLGAEGFRDLALLAWAGKRAVEAHASAADSAAWTALLDRAAAWVPVDLPVKGRDAVALGVAPGPDVGRLLAAVDRWWEENDYRPGREECLERLKALLQSSSRPET